MFKTFAIAGLATALLFGAVPAQALITGNGLSVNALTENALTENALTENALTENSIQPTAVAGRQSLGTATGLHIIAVELPAAR
jgi:hypothetical protein